MSRKIVIGFPLHYEDVMEYARRSGFKLYPYVNARNEKDGCTIFDFDNKIRYNPEKPEKYSPDSYGLVFSKNDLGDKVKTDEILKKKNFFDEDKINREDPILIKLVKSKKDHILKVVEIPDDVNWHIEETESGNEYVAEDHRTWG